MSGFYIGVDGKARKVTGGYIGIDGKARKIKKGYIGDENGVARLCWSGDSFADTTWEEIAAACQSGTVPDNWAVGEQKTMTIDGVDYTVDIIGKNHDDYADGSGKAPLTFQLHDCYSEKYGIGSPSSNTASWVDSIMRSDTLPEILSLMPAVVQASVKEVTKKTAAAVTSEKLFLLSEVEIFGTNTNTSANEGTQYAYYANGGTTVKTLDGSAQDYWERSPVPSYSYNFGMVSASGTHNNSHSKYARGVSFAFCF